MEELLQRGVAVIPYPAEIRQNFNIRKFLSEQKEFINSDETTTQFVMGGFGAFGNPSSFHHEEVRKLRLAIYTHVFPLFRQAFPGKYIEGIVDRFAKRFAGSSLSPEDWHRDISNVKNKKIHGEPDDNIFGGWVNLDETNEQFFTCVPSSHTEKTTGSGFALISKSEHPQYKAAKEKICIPPNHLIIFNEKIAHVVTATKTKTDSYRLFMKYRITRNPECALFSPAEISKIIEEQGVFPLSLEQIPPMYSKTHMRSWKPRVKEFSLNIKPQFLAPKKNKKTVAAIVTATATTADAADEANATAIENQLDEPLYVMRFMPSLKQAGVETFAPYTAAEKKMLTLIKLE